MQNNFWIWTRGDPWHVIDVNGKYICSCPAFDYDLVERIYRASNKEEIVSILENEKNARES